MASKLYNLRFVASLLWLGFVLAISFMEAPLKFQAPSVSLPIGLEVGRIVFGALNKVEWVLLMMIAVSLTISHHSKKGGALMLSLLTILLIQTFYLLPVLDARAGDIINGIAVAENNMHFYYVGIEVVKVALLIVSTHHFIKRTSN